ncbi:flavin reductase family protein [Enterovirga sp. CN4-39]|uniref:flavin reductase family protein n=1 Tax=Enterovirga sp. CN4-39 TaxID=3400910 RepID=UPI003C04754E
MLSLPLDREATDPKLLRQALGRFATGVTVITTRAPDGKCEGLTANSFSAVSLDPPLVLWSLRLASPSLPSFKSSGAFVVNVLSSEQSTTSQHFATPRHDKFEDVAFSEGIGGCPMLDGSLAIFECRTESMIEGGDHMIFIGRVIQAHYREGEPLIFAGGRYGTHTPLED